MEAFDLDGKPISIDTRPPMPRNFSWYSVCSGHGCRNPSHDHRVERYCPDCPRCNAGRWVNDEQQELSSWLYKENPKLWLKWANRETKEGEPGHESRHFLEKIFPGLLGK